MKTIKVSDETYEKIKDQLMPDIPDYEYPYYVASSNNIIYYFRNDMNDLFEDMLEREDLKNCWDFWFIENDKEDEIWTYLGNSENIKEKYDVDF